MLTAESTLHQPLGYPRPVPGMGDLVIVGGPPFNVTSRGFYFGYIQMDSGSRIELGIYQRGVADGGRIKLLEDLDESNITILGIPPAHKFVNRVVIVANDYVLVDLSASHVDENLSRGPFTEGSSYANRLISSYMIDSLSLVKFSMPDVVAKRKHIMADLLARGIAMHQVNIGMRKDHGWLQSDKESAIQ